MTACATVCVDLGWIRKGRKLADFEQKAWAIAHDCEHGRFWQLLEIAPNSLKRLQNNSKMICDCLPTVCVDLGWIRKGRKLTGLEQKVWAAAHGFEHGQLWQVLELAPNSLKRPQNRSKMICDCLRDCLCQFRVNSYLSTIGRFEQRAWAIGHDCENGRLCQLLEVAPNSLQGFQKRSKIICDCLPTVCVDLEWIRKGRKLADFEQKAWAIAHGFEHGSFCLLLEIPPNSLKRLQNHSKIICDCLRDCLFRFRVNS